MGQHNDPCRMQAGFQTDTAQDRDSIEAWHVDFQDKNSRAQRGSCSPELPERLFAVSKPASPVPLVQEHAQEHVGDRVILIDNHYVELLGRNGPAVPTRRNHAIPSCRLCG